MARKLRLEFAGACYHVRHRGNDRRDLFAQGGAESFLNPSPMPIQFPIRNFEVFSPAKFIAALVAQIPPKGVPLVRYYGWYSNKTRGLRQQRATAAAGSAPTALPPPPRRRRIGWRELIKQVWGADPLKCPLCSGLLRPIAV